MRKRYLYFMAIALVVVAVTTRWGSLDAQQVQYVWTGGPGTHSDAFAVQPEGDQLSLFFIGNVDGSTGAANELAYAPADVLIVASAGRMTEHQATLGILGASSGPVWLMPAAPTSESPGYDWTNMTGWTDATLTLEAVSVPSGARLALWETDAFGDAQIRWDSNAAIPQDFVIGSPAHGHVSWGLTHEGLYVLRVQASATDPQGVTRHSPSRTYQVCVTAQQNPSPGQIAEACGLAAQAEPTATPAATETPAEAAAPTATPAPHATAPAATVAPASTREPAAQTGVRIGVSITPPSTGDAGLAGRPVR